MNTIFSSAKVVAVNADPESYHASSPVSDRGGADFLMSAGALRDFIACPHRWVNGWTSKPSDATEWGTAYDGYLLGGKFAERFAVTPKTYAAPATHEKVKRGKISEGSPLPWNANAGICEQWEKDQGSKIIVPSRIFDEIEAAAKRIEGDFRDFIDCSQHQVFIIAEYLDPETKLVIPFKCLIDMVPDCLHPTFGKSLGDLKSSVCAAPGFWDRAVFEHGYHIQAAAYLHAYRAAVRNPDDDRQDFTHLVQEKQAPFETCLHFLEQPFLEAGERALVEGLRDYAECIKTGYWPGYDSPRFTTGRMVLGGRVQTQMQAWMLK